MISISKKLSYKEVKEYIETNSECKLLSTKYIDCDNNLLLLCGCGQEFEVRLRAFKSNNKRCCNKCSNKNKGERKLLTIDTVNDFIINNSSCKLISKEYMGIFNKLDLMCECDEIFHASFHDIKKMKIIRCSKCRFKDFSLKQTYTYEYVKEYVENCGFELLDNNYIVYKKLTISDSNGYLYYCNFGDIKKYILSKINIVNPKNIYSINNIKLWLILNRNDVLLLSDTYQRHNKKLSFKCLNKYCNKEFKSSWNNIQQGFGCPYCIQSKGEKEIINYLDINNIFYSIQHKFKDCKKLRPLPFDFAIFEDEEKTKLKYLIEYDGEFHYEPSRYSKNKEKMLRKLKSQQENDNIKNNYCIINNIDLIRIPYWDFDNIDEILENILFKGDFKIETKNLYLSSVNTI